MFNSVVNKSGLDSIVDTIKNDPEKRREFLKFSDYPRIVEYALKTYSLKPNEALIVYARVKKFDDVKKIVEYNIDVSQIKAKDDEGKEITHSGEYIVKQDSGIKYVKQGVTCDGLVPTIDEVLVSQGTHISSLLDAKNDKVVPVVLPATIADAMKPRPLKLAKIAAAMNDVVAVSSDVVEETMIKEIKGSSNSSLCDLYIKAAPKSYKIKTASIQNKKVLIPPKYNAETGSNFKQALTVCKALSKGMAPTSSHMAKHCSNHVYGISVPNDARRYVDFLADFVLPKDVNTVHLHTGDIKYAIGLYHRYPNLNIVMRGNVNVEANTKKKIRITYNTPSKLAANAGRKDVMGVFFDYMKIPDDGKAEFQKRAVEVDAEGKILPKTYKYFFRYMSVFAVSEDDVLYRTSAAARELKCIETNYEPLYNGKTAILHCAKAGVHYITYPFIMVPMIRTASFMPELQGSFSLKVDRTIAAEMYETGFISFMGVQSDEDSDYAKLVGHAVDVAGKENKKLRRLKGEKVENKEEEEEEDDSDNDGGEDHELEKNKKNKPDDEADDDETNAFMGMFGIGNG